MSYSSLKPRLAPTYLKPRLTDKQEYILEQAFKKKKYPDEDEFARLSSETGLIRFDIKVWFEDRIAKWRLEEGLSPNIKHVSELKSSI